MNYDPFQKPINTVPRVVIVGAGGHGRVVLDVLVRAGQCQISGFLDSSAKLHGRRMDGVPVLGDLSMLERLRDEGKVSGAIVAIGDNGVRRAFAEQIDAMGIPLVNAIHPSANLARSVTVGRNVVIAAGALVCAHCQIGDSSILNTGCIVDHESMIGTAAHVCPGARLAGRVTVEAGAFVGIGATVVQSLRIGCEAVVGAGAVVIRDVPPMTTVVGVPARAVHADDEESHDWLLPEFVRSRSTNIRKPPQVRTIVEAVEAAQAADHAGVQG
jgi:sugar O-acyltransferase (sialic acid O-acetyltransferase NeuD family)